MPQHRLATFAREFARDIHNEKYDRSDEGILLKRSALLKGVYIEGIRGQPDSFRRHPNLLVDEGILAILAIALGATVKNAAYYIAPFSGATAPAANLTAANFASTQSEITSGTEGYSEATRGQWVPAAPAANKITNAATLAAFTIVTASQLNITGSALLSASAKGATTGALISAAKFAATRVLNNTDVWDAGYEVSLSDV